MIEPAFHQLVPEEPSVVPTVHVTAVWRDLVDVIGASSAKDRLFAKYATREVSAGEHTDQLRVQETAVAILNLCVRNELFTLRINSGSRFYKVSAQALVTRFDPADGLANADATTWSSRSIHLIAGRGA